MATPNETLANGKIWVGNSSNVKRPVTLSGDLTISNAGVATVVAGAGSVASVTVTNAELKALRATPKTLVAAGGAGTVIEFLGATLKRTTATNTLTESDDNLAVKYTNGSGVAVSDTIEATGFIDGTAATTTHARAASDVIAAYTASANQALVLHNTGDGEYDGNAANDATLVLSVRYRVVTI